MPKSDRERAFRRFLHASFLPAALLWVGAISPAAAESASRANEIRFQTRVNGKKGVVRCALFTKSGWLEKAVSIDTASINGSSATCRFSGIKPGVYALSAFHDENENNELDTNLVGMPIEDYCASNNARNMFAPPSFDDAKFTFRGGSLTLKAQMK